MIAAVLLAIACFIASITEAIESYGWLLFTILSVIAGISIYRYIKKDDAYTDDFKKNVIGEIVQYLNPGMIYKPDSYVSSKEYRRSCLYRKHYDYYDGDDLLQGKYKEVSFYCSEIHTYYVGGIRNNYITIFKGLFFVAGVNEGFTAGTYVWPRDEDQFARSIGEEFRFLPMPEVIELHMKYEPFEKYFCACSTDPREARTILTPAMMDMLVRFRKQLGRKISFSVVAGRCYVAIPISEDLLEPSADPTDKEEIKKHFFTVLLVFSIINQLELSRLS